MSLRIVLRAGLLGAFLWPACVVNLTDRNSPLINGGVSGLAANCAQVTPEPKSSPTGDAAIKFVGRFVLDPPAADPTKQGANFDWSGNSIQARFEGTKVTVGLNILRLCDNPSNGQCPPTSQDPVARSRTADVDAFCQGKGEKDLFFTIAVDGVAKTVRVSNETDASGVQRVSYAFPDTLAPNVPHEVVVQRNSEALFGDVYFTGFDFGPGGRLLPSNVRARRIEIIGDSITCGYGDEGTTANCPFTKEVRECSFAAETENNYVAYGSLTGRALDADVVTLCWSGRGVSRNYRDPVGKDGTLEKDATTTMPQFYERTLANNAEVAWDFTKEPQPQVVVISLGTNDYARDNNLDNNADGFAPGERETYQNEYRQFVAKVRQLRPNAHIFLALSPMLTDQFPFENARSDAREDIRQIVAAANQGGDAKVYSIEFVEQGTRYGLGCDYHPNLEVHRIMADQLTGAIRSKTCW